MKKLFYLFAFLTVVLSSCSSSTSEENIPTPILVTKITSEENSIISTRDFTYNGTKLSTETTSNGLVKYYTYNGDYITYIETKNSSNTTTYETFIEYNTSNKISKITNLNHTASNPNFAGTKREFIYNTDGTIIDNLYVGTITEQNLNTSTSVFYSDSQGQLIKIDDRYPNGDIYSSYEYDYDAKKSPFYNVTGYDALLFHFFNKLNSVKNNRISINEVLNNTYSASCTFSYNSFDFPTANTFTDSNGALINYQYFYNQ